MSSINPHLLSSVIRFLWSEFFSKSFKIEKFLPAQATITSKTANMQFSHIATFGLFSLALAGHMKRTAATVESDIATISTDLTSFDASINSFTGKLVQALALLSAYDTLAGAVTTATSDVASTGALDASDSGTIYTAVSSLTTQVATTLSDAVAKASVPKNFGWAIHN